MDVNDYLELALKQAPDLAGHYAVRGEALVCLHCDRYQTHDLGSARAHLAARHPAALPAPVVTISIVAAEPILEDEQ